MTERLSIGFNKPAFWEANPLLIPTLGCILGIGLADAFAASVWVWGALLGIGLALLSMPLPKWVQVCGLWVCWVGLGLACGSRMGPNNPYLLPAEATSVTLKGIVEPPIYSTQWGSRFNLQVTELRVDTGWLPVELTLWTNVPGQIADAPLAGYELTAICQITRLPDTTAFFRQLARQGVDAQAECKLVQQGSMAKGLSSLMARWQATLSERVRQWVPSPQQHSLATALLLDYRTGMDSGVRADFQASGLSHILALSGGHIVFLMAFLGGALQLLLGWTGRRGVASGVLIVFLVTYCLVSGAGPSVVRATLFGVVVLLAPLLGRQLQPINAVCGVCLMQLCITPSDLFSPGFLLSYSAVLGILLYSPPLLHRVKVRNSAARWLRDVAVVSVAAQIGVLPVMLCVFGTLPTYFLPANIVAGLLGTWALGVGFLLLLLADVPGLAGALGFAFDWLLFLLHQVANFFANLPGAVIAGLAIPTWAGVLMALGIFALGIGLQKRKPLNEDAHLRRLGLL